MPDRRRKIIGLSVFAGAMAYLEAAFFAPWRTGEGRDRQPGAMR